MNSFIVRKGKNSLFVIERLQKFQLAWLRICLLKHVQEATLISTKQNQTRVHNMILLRESC